LWGFPTNWRETVPGGDPKTKSEGQGEREHE
jgi:hypothetical protein